MREVIWEEWWMLTWVRINLVKNMLTCLWKFSVFSQSIQSELVPKEPLKGLLMLSDGCTNMWNGMRSDGLSSNGFMKATWIPSEKALLNEPDNRKNRAYQVPQFKHHGTVKKEVIYAFAYLYTHTTPIYRHLMPLCQVIMVKIASWAAVHTKKTKLNRGTISPNASPSVKGTDWKNATLSDFQNHAMCDLVEPVLLVNIYILAIYVLEHTFWNMVTFSF